MNNADPVMSLGLFFFWGGGKVPRLSQWMCLDAEYSETNCRFNLFYALPRRTV